ncbi:YdeI/OmpD-associated family protein [Mycolicibacterium sp. P9-22]|uniref:YdeI/OmpD-associated family protein n=1 Tax=Mycolicibacterium sp. P9-22 TaxID=2024613 RepID=UPI0011EE1207|nr:YdeI/OmpD-associated family protein [Mycolicibacterium sp. P9-22]KAA0116961.1 DUF1905 domain-containing protein [Mycolicibacterium sp. P9-22]
MPEAVPSTSFATVLFQDGNNTGVEVPESAVAALGRGKRPAVLVEVNGFRFRSTVAPMGGKFLIPFSAARREASGITGGDAIDVTLTVDTEPRTVEVPEDLRAALHEAGATAAWDALSYSKRKEHARSVTAAKKPETRARRVETVVAKLA